MPWEISCCFLGYFSWKLRDTSFCKSSIADCPQAGWKGQRATGLSRRPWQNSVRSKTAESDVVEICAYFYFHICFLKNHQLLFAYFCCTGTQRDSLQWKSPKWQSMCSSFTSGHVAAGDHSEWRSSGTKQLLRVNKLAFPQDHGASTTRRDVKANWECDWR